MVAQWLALLPHSAMDLGSIPSLGSLSEWSLHVLPVSAWVSSGCSGFLGQSKDVQVRIPTVQKEAIQPIESAPTTIPSRPYLHNSTYLPA